MSWLVDYRTAGLHAAAEAWLYRTAPYDTDQLAQQNNQLHRDGYSPGMAWRDFAAR